jgi:hypothetical protein
MEEIDCYWKLEFKDGNSILVNPNHATEIKRQLKEGRMLTTADWVRSVSDIKSFEKTSQPIKTFKRIGGMKDAVARAFDEPIINDDGSVDAKWVKKLITKIEWVKYYSKQPNYKLLNDSEVAFKLPTHLIDLDKYTELTQKEIDIIY